MGPPLQSSLNSEWRHCTGLEGRYNLWTEKKSSFLNDLSGPGWRWQQNQRATCGSGHAREAGAAGDGTGFAGVRGHARSHSGPRGA
ncbi:hypothetical protein C6A77_14890 [Pseudomonas sp. AFG_SD02_1510_Pfu_092]|nr:hypothetical protein C6A77_14890 [Pseudomonas sp. AFG_SD02_1510_Pfu_092]